MSTSHIDLVSLKRQIVGRGKFLAETIARIHPDCLTGKHSDCPLHGGALDFRFDNKDGLGTYICTCSAGDIFTLVMKARNCDFGEAVRLIHEALNGSELPAPTASKRKLPESDRETKRRTQWFWQETKAITFGTPPDKYLFSRGLGIVNFPSALRFHPAAGTKVDDQLQFFPAMVAMYSHPDGKPNTVHRTFLNADGGKAFADPKKCKKLMPGSVSKGGAIRLFDVIGDTLGVAEGIETALSAHALYGIPTWAAYSDHGMENFQPPDTIRNLIVFADNDRNEAGQKAAEALRTRIEPLGINVEILIPEGTGQDLNDVLLALENERAA
jgi:putative DNA primase/helicase